MLCNDLTYGVCMDPTAMLAQQVYMLRVLKQCYILLLIA